MFELITVVNLVVASFMIGEDYEEIQAYQTLTDDQKIELVAVNEG